MDVLEKSAVIQELTTLMEEYLRIEYVKKRSGLSGKKVHVDKELLRVQEQINSLSSAIGFSKTKLRQFKSETRRSLRSSQGKQLRKARQTPGFKSKKIKSNADIVPSVYSLPKTIKLWSR